MRRRTYDDEDQGDAIRHGFEPSEVPMEIASEFAVGDDEEESNHQRTSPPNASSYDEFDDRHVWNKPDDR